MNKGIKPIENNEIVKINNVPYMTTYTITNASRDWSGTYTITATNASGTDTADVEIIVVSKPGKPKVSDICRY